MNWHTWEGSHRRHCGRQADPRTPSRPSWSPAWGRSWTYCATVLSTPSDCSACSGQPWWPLSSWLPHWTASCLLWTWWVAECSSSPGAPSWLWSPPSVPSLSWLSPCRCGSIADCCPLRPHCCLADAVWAGDVLSVQSHSNCFIMISSSIIIVRIYSSNFLKESHTGKLKLKINVCLVPTKKADWPHFTILRNRKYLNYPEYSKWRKAESWKAEC